MDAVRVPKKPRSRLVDAAQQPPAFQHPLSTELGKTVYEAIQRNQSNVPPLDVLEAFLIAYIVLKTGSQTNPGTVVDMTLLDKPLLMSLIGPTSENIRLGDIRQCLGIYFHNDFRDSVTDFARLVKYVYDSLIRANLISPPATPPASPQQPLPYSPSSKSTTASAPPAPPPPPALADAEGPARRVSVKRSSNGKVLIGYKGWGVKRIQSEPDRGAWTASFELDVEEEEEGATQSEAAARMGVRRVHFDCAEWSDSLAKAKAEAFEFKLDRGCQVGSSGAPSSPALQPATKGTPAPSMDARLRAYTRRIKSVPEWVSPPQTEKHACAACGAAAGAERALKAAAPSRSWHYVDLFARFFA